MKNLTLSLLVLIAVLFLLKSADATQVSTLDDIRFWVGSGSNRSALVIDWQGSDDSDVAQVWGYRWDDSATGRDLLTAVVAADERLFARMNMPAQSATIVYGLGYDTNNDAQFEIDDPLAGFDEFGIAVSGPVDGGLSIDPADDYQEGWLSGFWHYGTGHSPGDLVSTQIGLATRQLSDGSWDAWTFAKPISFSAFPANLHAALPSAMPGDFDASGVVDTGDYTKWLTTLGQVVSPAGSDADGNRNGIVDLGDYEIWKANLGQQLPDQGEPSAIPEPSTIHSLFLLFLVQCLRFRPQ